MKKQRLLWAGLLPTAGFACCYLLPLGMTIYYALTGSAFDRRFAGLSNFAYILQNRYFHLGMRNLIGLGSCMVLSAMLSALVIAPLLCRHPRLALSGMGVLLLPLLFPSVSAVTLWKAVFSTSSTRSPASSQLSLITLYLWKYTGIGAALLYTALKRIPQAVLDAAALDGAGEIRIYLSIRLPLVGGPIAGAVIFLMMFMLRIYKESYLLFGEYPAPRLYMLQHYMNNQYMKMNFQYVAACAVLLSLLSLALYAAGGCALYRRKQP